MILLPLLLAVQTRAADLQSFAAARDGFVGSMAALRPEAGTGLGLPEYNGKLVPPTPLNIAEQIAYFEGLERSAAQGASGDLDREVMLTVARSQLRDLRDNKTYLEDPTAAQNPYSVLQQQLAQAGQGSDAAQDWRDIAARAELIPAYVRAVRENLRAGAAQGRRVYRGFVQKDGIEAAGEAAAFFELDLLEKARQQLSAGDFAALEPRLRAAGGAAAAEYSAQADFLRAEILPRATATFGIGEREYAWKLKNELGIRESPAELQAKGLSLAAELRAKMEALAAKIDPSKPLPDLMAELRADHPKDDAELLAKYREVSERARDFVVAHKLFAIPADYRIDVIETPGAMRSHIGSAAYFPAPPLQAGKKGVFLVTPSGGDAKRLAVHNFAKIPTTVVHEAFPGHDMQFWTFQRSNIPTVRHLMDQAGFSYSLNVEGYAHYAEELMRQRGFFTPKEELMQLASQLWRAMRIVLDVAVHTRQVSLEEASTRLAQEAFLPQAIANVEPYRYAKMPTQAITYLLGRLEIERLKKDYAASKGSGYDEAAFHREFLSYGPILPALIRRAMGL